jgi:hypothetical protein
MKKLDRKKKPIPATIDNTQNSFNAACTDSIPTKTPPPCLLFNSCPTCPRIKGAVHQRHPLSATPTSSPPASTQLPHRRPFWAPAAAAASPSTSHTSSTLAHAAGHLHLPAPPRVRTHTRPVPPRYCVHVSGWIRPTLPPSPLCSLRTNPALCLPPVRCHTRLTPSSAMSLPSTCTHIVRPSAPARVRDATLVLYRLALS